MKILLYGRGAMPSGLLDETKAQKLAEYLLNIEFDYN
ncbi:hypothetical protein CYOC110262_21520 [Cytobacillus oceanisediminis]